MDERVERWGKGNKLQASLVSENVGVGYIVRGGKIHELYVYTRERRRIGQEDWMRVGDCRLRLMCNGRWMDEVDEIMMGESSKTVVRGKQNNTGLGGAMENGEIYMTHKAKVATTDSAPVSWTDAPWSLTGRRAF